MISLGNILESKSIIRIAQQMGAQKHREAAGIYQERATLRENQKPQEPESSLSHQGPTEDGLPSLLTAGSNCCSSSLRSPHPFLHLLHSTFEFHSGYLTLHPQETQYLAKHLCNTGPCENHPMATFPMQEC